MIEQYIPVFPPPSTLPQLALEYGGLPAIMKSFGTSLRSFTIQCCIRESNGEIYAHDRNRRIFVFNKDTTLNRTVTTTPPVAGVALRLSESRGVYTNIGFGTTNSGIVTYDFGDNVVNNVVTTGFRLGNFDYAHGTGSTIWASTSLTPNSRTIVEVDYTTGATSSQFTIPNINQTATAIRARPTTNQIWVGGNGGRLSFFDQTTLAVTDVFTTFFGTNPGNVVNTINDITFSFDGSRIFLRCSSRVDNSSGNYFNSVTEINDTGTIINEWNGNMDIGNSAFGSIDYSEAYTEKVLLLNSQLTNIFRCALMVIE